MGGLPSFAAWIQNTQIRTAAESFQNGLQFARAEAVRRNANVQLVLGTQSSWTICVLPLPCPPVLPALPIQTRDYGAGSKNVTVVAVPANATTITFNSLGRVVANADASATVTHLDFYEPTDRVNHLTPLLDTVEPTGGVAFQRVSL
jgi:type IV fimbrial biogenesis protein FimT